MANIEDVSTFAKELLLKDGFHAPTLIMQGAKKTAMGQFANLPADSDLRKKGMLELGKNIAGKFKEMGKLEKVFLISEAWASEVKKKDFSKESFVSPSKDPNRVEVLLIVEMDVKDNKTDARFFKMIRDKADKLIKVVGYKNKAFREGTVGEFKSTILDALLIGYTKTTMGIEVNPDVEVEEINRKVDKELFGKKDEDIKKSKYVN